MCDGLMNDTLKWQATGMSSLEIYWDAVPKDSPNNSTPRWDDDKEMFLAVIPIYFTPYAHIYIPVCLFL